VSSRAELGPIRLRRERPAGHDHDPDDPVAVERQTQRKVTLIRKLRPFTPTRNLTRPGYDVASKTLELGLRLFEGECSSPPAF
jgi:hypothetical protein